MVRPRRQVPGPGRRSCAGWPPPANAPPRAVRVRVPRTTAARGKGRGRPRRARRPLLCTAARRCSCALPPGTRPAPARRAGPRVVGAAGVFMAFVLYGGWDGGRFGHALAVALGWMLGRARSLTPARVRRRRRGAVAAPGAAGAASAARRCRLPVRRGHARARRRNARHSGPGPASGDWTSAHLASHGGVRRGAIPRSPTAWCRTSACRSSPCSCC